MTLEELEAENEQLKQQLADVQKGPQWRNLEQRVTAAEADATKFKGLYESARTQLVTSAVQLAGFKPNEQGEYEGPAALVVEKFQTSLGDEDVPTADAFVEMAKKYGIAPAGGAPVDGGGDPLGFANQIAAMQQGGDVLSRLGTAPIPADLDEQIAAAEKAGDIPTSISLKQQKAYGASVPA